MRCAAADGAALLTGSMPVKEFEKIFIQKTKLENITTGDDINRAIENKSGLPNLVKNFYFDADAFKHLMDSRNQELCEAIGRRTAANASTKRLTARIAANHDKYDDQREYIIDLSEIDDFFLNRRDVKRADRHIFLPANRHEKIIRVHSCCGKSSRLWRTCQGDL